MPLSILSPASCSSSAPGLHIHSVYVGYLHFEIIFSTHVVLRRYTIRAKKIFWKVSKVIYPAFIWPFNFCDIYQLLHQTICRIEAESIKYVHHFENLVFYLHARLPMLNKFYFLISHIIYAVVYAWHFDKHMIICWNTQVLSWCHRPPNPAFWQVTNHRS